MLRRDVVKRGGITLGVMFGGAITSCAVEAQPLLTGISVITSAGVDEGDTFTVASDAERHQCSSHEDEQYNLYRIEFPSYRTHLAVESTVLQPTVNTSYRIRAITNGTLCSSASATFDRLIYREI